MLGLFDFLPLLFAEEAPAAGPGGGSMFVILLYLAPVIVLYYVFLKRPMDAQEKKRRELVAALKKNDRVLTQAGIYGTVVSVGSEGDKVVLRVDDDRGVKMEFTKASVVRVLDGSNDKADDKA
jgi:preprotein translocase subunit YajC